MNPFHILPTLGIGLPGLESPVPGLSGHVSFTINIHIHAVSIAAYTDG